jgi:integrase
MVLRAGIEPAHPEGYRILSPTFGNLITILGEISLKNSDFKHLSGNFNLKVSKKMSKKGHKMREKKGYIFEENGKFYARVTFTDSKGIKRNVKRTAKSKSKAEALLKKLINQIEAEGEKGLEAEKMTFNDLCNYYEKHYAKPAKFIDNRKVEGLRDLGRVKGFLKEFRKHFGKMKLRQISYGDILDYRNERLKVETHYKKPRTITTMNRELAYLRRVFNIALRQNWISKNPINCGESLIDVSAERRRERVLSLAEEKRLLDACTGRRAHLKPLIIFLLSTGARIGETLKLKWADIDFQNELITFQALNTKTLKTRKVAITNTLNEELLSLWNKSDKNLDSSVFKFKGVTKAFNNTCNDVGIETGRPFGITLHSLRHTVASRLVKKNFPLQFTARILGHQSVTTTFRYLTVSDDELFQASEILESYQGQISNDAQVESTLIN